MSSSPQNWRLPAVSSPRSHSPHHGILDYHQHELRQDQRSPLMRSDVSDPKLAHQYLPHHVDSDLSSEGESYLERGDIDCLGLTGDSQGDFIHVGLGRGSFNFVARSDYGYFQNVGEGLGEYEPDRNKRPRVTCRCLARFFCFSTMVAGIVWAIHLLQPASLEDCSEGLANTRLWSQSKKRFCCYYESVGCGEGEFSDPTHEIPVWLNFLLGDMDIGFKFVFIGSLLLCSGFCCGIGLMHCCLLKVKPHAQVQSEAGIEKEMQKVARRMGCVPESEAELSVTLMWDTKDDLDLRLVLPSQLGEISSDFTHCEGGFLDCDGNRCLERDGIKPIERIVFPRDPRGRHGAPEGKYEVWVQLHEVHNMQRPPNLSVCVMAGGHKVWHSHLHLPPGQPKVLVGTIDYDLPDRKAKGGGRR